MSEVVTAAELNAEVERSLHRCSYLTCNEPARVDYCEKHTLEVIATLAQRILKQVYP